MICIGGVADGQDIPVNSVLANKIRMVREREVSPIRAAHMSASRTVEDSWYNRGRIQFGKGVLVEFLYDDGMPEQDAILRVFSNYRPNCSCED